ncbi:hypothetical protein AGMMS50233_04480 [Endomicrobiia bacterium]|nr:hypothetical protein AGMMS50233_04480 [Endomicrobiia bacterium]
MLIRSGGGFKIECKKGLIFGGEGVGIKARVIDVRKSEVEQPNKTAKIHAQKKKEHTIRLSYVLHGEILH